MRPHSRLLLTPMMRRASDGCEDARRAHGAPQSHHRRCGERAVTSADGPTEASHGVFVAKWQRGMPVDGRALVLGMVLRPARTDARSRPRRGHAACGGYFQASDPVANQGSGMSSHTSQRKPHITPIIPAIMTNPLSAQIPIGKVPAPSTISASARRRSVPSSASGVGCGPGARSLRLSARCRPRQRHVAVCVVGVVTIVGYVLAGAELRTRSGTPRRAPPKEYVCWTDRRYGEMCEPADRQPTARRHYARDVY
jgi:hypothetical protein